MDFRIADTFTVSLGRLSGDEQKAAKTTAFDLQIDPTSPGMSFHKLDRARDKNFWSRRVSSNIRLIVHKTADSLLLCYVDHHDKAYDWAERRKVETHPNTGAAQLVELRETVQDIVIPNYVVGPAPAAVTTPLFAAIADDELLGYGVPAEWMSDVRGATDDTLLAVASHLPAEAAEAILELATGGKPRTQQPIAAPANPFDHPDAQRRFRIMSNLEELERALDFPWDKWTVFLHPEQRQWVERDQSGPARVSGSAGTGKTVVALHRAVHLARTHPDARVLLATFSDALANDLRARLFRLVSNQPTLADQIEVYAINGIGERLYAKRIGEPRLATSEFVNEALREASVQVADHKFSDYFLRTEWEHVVDAWHLDNWEAYRDVARLGRKTRLPEPQRAVLWSIFERVRGALAGSGQVTYPMLFSRLAGEIVSAKNPPFEFAVIDEAQDLSVSHLRFFSAIGGNRPNALFFAGDLGQRIFQQPFSWRALGVDIRGRSRTLRVNYRTSHQIRSQADRLLGPQVADVDGNTEDRGDTVSVFNGPPPTVQTCQNATAEALAVAGWISDRLNGGVTPDEIAVFVRSEAELPRAESAVRGAGQPYTILDQRLDHVPGHVSISTMHRAKGLEFRAVAVMACDDEVIPLQQRIESVGDDADLQEVYDTERHLLYVACTRARDFLLVTGVDPASEFLDDLRA